MKPPLFFIGWFHVLYRFYRPSPCPPATPSTFQSDRTKKSNAKSQPTSGKSHRDIEYRKSLYRLPQRRNGVDAVFECSGAAPALDLALKLARRKGRIIQVGLFGKNLSVDMDKLVFKDLTYKGSFTSSATSWKRALELTGTRQVDTHSLVSDILPLEAFEQAFALAADRSRLKVVFQP